MKYTIITGASRGIGKELAYVNANKGHNLILIARRYDLLLKIKSDLQAKYNVLIECIKCDLTNLEETEKIINFINDNYLINCLINNAGIGLFESIEDIKKESLLSQTTLNFITPILITKILIPQLRQNNGSIINICSVLSYIPNSLASIYVGTKHALYGFSNTIRLEYPDIHVLTVHPKTVKTTFFQDETYLNNNRPLDASIVAHKVYKAYKKKKRILNIPKTLFFLHLFYQFFPKSIDKINIRFFSKK